MSTNGPNNGIILYHYPFSPFAHRVTWYLTLRGIDYAQCLQPVMLPRPDINALGLAYRRIPIMAIGRDIYCDTRQILPKLEELFPDGALGASTPEQKALERLLSTWTVEQVFPRAGQLLPPQLPLMKDPKFQADRADYSGRNWNPKAMAAARPDALVYIRQAFDKLETTVFADGRDWVLKTTKPSLADIEAIWPFHWLNGLDGALPADLISPHQFPRVFAWIQRFDDALKNARAAGPKPPKLDGTAAQDRILKADLSKPVGVQANDPLHLSQGQLVEVWPMDTGFNHRDRGQLIGLNEEEIVIECPTREGSHVSHVHFPRVNYRVKAIEGTKL